MQMYNTTVQYKLSVSAFAIILYNDIARYSGQF